MLDVVSSENQKKTLRFVLTFYQKANNRLPTHYRQSTNSQPTGFFWELFFTITTDSILSPKSSTSDYLVLISIELKPSTIILMFSDNLFRYSTTQTDLCISDTDSYGRVCISLYCLRTPLNTAQSFRVSTITLFFFNYRKPFVASMEWSLKDSSKS